MKRRQFVEHLGIGSAVIAAATTVGHAREDEHDEHHGANGAGNATVSFGAWPVGTAEVPLDRTVTPFAPVAPNVHALIPQTVTIKEGGSVNFILGGFHQVIVRRDGAIRLHEALLRDIKGAERCTNI